LSNEVSEGTEYTVHWIKLGRDIKIYYMKDFENKLFMHKALEYNI